MNINLDDPKLTAYALDELSGVEKAEIETALAASPEAQELVNELRLLSGNLRAEYAADVEEQPMPHSNIVPISEKDEPWSLSRRLAFAAGIALCACLGAIAIGTIRLRSGRGLASSEPLGAPPSRRAFETPVEGIDSAAARISKAPTELTLEEPPPPPTQAKDKEELRIAAAAPLASQNFAAVKPLSPPPSAGSVALDNFRREAEQPFNTARYGKIEENPFLAASKIRSRLSRSTSTRPRTPTSAASLRTARCRRRMRCGSKR